MHSSARINSLIKIKYKAIENYNERQKKKNYYKLSLHD